MNAHFAFIFAFNAIRFKLFNNYQQFAVRNFGALFIANGDLIFHWQQFTAFGQWNNKNQFQVFLWRHYLFTTRALYSLLSDISAMNLLRNWILNRKHKEIRENKAENRFGRLTQYVFNSLLFHLFRDLISDSESYK